MTGPAGGFGYASGTSPRLYDEVLSILSRPEDVELAELVSCGRDLRGSEPRAHDPAGEATTCRHDGIEPLVCSSDDTFCRHTMNTDGVFPSRTPADPRFADIGWVDGTLAKRPVLRLRSALRPLGRDGRAACA